MVSASRISLATVGIFTATVHMMALKPLMIHLTRGEDAKALPPFLFLFQTESLKVFFCSLALLARCATGFSAPLWCGLRHTARFVLPATLYLIMNALTVHNARILEPPIFQLLANTKILATAAAAYVVMRRPLSFEQWLALLILSAGVTIGQHRGSLEVGRTQPVSIALMLLNSCISATAGVLAESALKAPEGKSLSIFATNIHMAVHTMWVNAVVLGLQLALTTSTVDAHPSLWSFSVPSAGTVVALVSEALNGILVSLLMRQADSIVKNYAFSVSIFIVAGVSVVIYGYVPEIQFFIGAGLTIFSMVLYVQQRPPFGSQVSRIAKARFGGAAGIGMAISVGAALCVGLHAQSLPQGASAI